MCLRYWKLVILILKNESCFFIFLTENCHIKVIPLLAMCHQLCSLFNLFSITPVTTLLKIALILISAES